MWVSNSTTCSAACFYAAAETTVTCCQSFIYTSELFCSTKTSGLWLLSDWRSEICGIPVQKRWCQRWEVLHHPQEPVASLKPEGKKKHIFSKKIITANVARTLVTGPPCVCLSSDCGQFALFWAGALRHRPAALSSAGRRKRRGGGECLGQKKKFKGVQRVVGTLKF